MLTLFLDTGSHENLLALCTEEKTLAIAPLPSHGDTELVPAMERILKESGHNYSDLTHLAAVLGPGGFTSLRVGVAAINALSYALNIPLAGIHLSDLWAERVLFERAPKGRVEKHKKDTLLDSSSASADSSLEENDFLWLHSTRRTQIFVKKYDSNDALVEILSLDDAIKLKGTYVGELIPEHQTLLTFCTRIEDAKLASLSEILPHILSSLSYERKELEPWYGRGTD